jgi:hypothetical protein
MEHAALDQIPEGIELQPLLNRLPADEFRYVKNATDDIDFAIRVYHTLKRHYGHPTMTYNEAAADSLEEIEHFLRMDEPEPTDQETPTEPDWQQATEPAWQQPSPTPEWQQPSPTPDWQTPGEQTVPGQPTVMPDPSTPSL